jgi:hypothetical protein
MTQVPGIASRSGTSVSVPNLHSYAPLHWRSAGRKAPIRHDNPNYYLFSPRGAPYTETSLRARWHRWLKTDDGKIVCEQWKAWVAEMVRKYEWEIDPEVSDYPTIHGLRGAGILLRRAVGHDVDQIANDIGMSRQMVERYMRFRDQMEVAAAGQARLRVIEKR